MYLLKSSHVPTRHMRPSSACAGSGMLAIQGNVSLQHLSLCPHRPSIICVVLYGGPTKSNKGVAAEDRL